MMALIVVMAMVVMVTLTLVMLMMIITIMMMMVMVMVIILIMVMARMIIMIMVMVMMIMIDGAPWDDSNFALVLYPKASKGVPPDCFLLSWILYWGGACSVQNWRLPYFVQNR